MSAGGTRRQKFKDIDDSPQKHFDEVMKISQNTANPEIVKLATELAPKPLIGWNKTASNLLQKRPQLFTDTLFTLLPARIGAIKTMQAGELPRLELRFSSGNAFCGGMVLTPALSFGKYLGEIL